jgi:hypothetical protein
LVSSQERIKYLTPNMSALEWSSGLSAVTIDCHRSRVQPQSPALPEKSLLVGNLAVCFRIYSDTCSGLPPETFDAKMGTLTLDPGRSETLELR